MKTPARKPAARDPALEVERVQTGVKIEKRLLKVLKGVAEYHDITLGDLLEGIVLHAFDGKAPFERASLDRIAQLIAAADALYDSDAIPDELWASLSAWLRSDQLLELVIVAGWYRLISYVINVAGIELEPWAERFPDAGASASAAARA